MSKLREYLTGGRDLGPCWLVDTDQLQAMRHRVHEAVTGQPLSEGTGLQSLCREDCVRPEHHRAMSVAEAFHRGAQLGRTFG